MLIDGLFACIHSFLKPPFELLCDYRDALCLKLPLGGVKVRSATFWGKYKIVSHVACIDLLYQQFPFPSSCSVMYVQCLWHEAWSTFSLICNLRVHFKLLPAGVCVSECVSVSVCEYSDSFWSKQLDSQRLCLWLIQVAVRSWDSWGQQTFFLHVLFCPSATDCIYS